MCVYVDGDFYFYTFINDIYIYSKPKDKPPPSSKMAWIQTIPKLEPLFGFPTLLGGFNKPPLPDQRHTPPGKLRVLSTENL